MSDYTPGTDFSATGGTLTGVAVGAEWSLIETAIATKTDGDGTAIEYTAATFTPTWTGFSSAPTGDLRYFIIGDGTHDFVQIMDDAGASRTGTSDADTMTITGIPAAIRPSTAVYLSSIFPVADNGGTTDTGFATISAAGTITFYMWGIGGFVATNFTSANAKGFTAGTILTYPLNLTT